MKKKDLALIAGVIILSAFFSMILSNVAFKSYKKQIIKVPVVQPISTNFPSPKTDSQYQSFFNKDAINPTQLINIGDQTTPAPFNQSQ